MDDDGEPYASKMYLIPESDYNLLLKEKHKEEQAPTPSHETPAPSQETSPPPPPASQEASLPPPPQVETGEGKRYSELDIKKFNRDFLTKQNIERFMENQKWGKIFERIKPYLENNSTDKKPPLVTWEEDRDFLVPAPKPLSQSEELLRRNVTIQPELKPTQTFAAKQAAARAESEARAREAVREAVEASARRDREKEKAFQISPIPPSEHRAKQADYVKQLFQSPDRTQQDSASRRRRSETTSASPFPPADSTRAKKKNRKKSVNESDDDDDPYADVDGARAGTSSGRGFKRFKKWEKF